MPRPRKLIELPFTQAAWLYLYYLAACDNPLEVGNCHDENLSQLKADIDRRSFVRMTPQTLANLVYHFKQCVLEQVSPLSEKNLLDTSYMRVMRELKKTVPSMFKEDADGDIDIIDFDWDIYRDRLRKEYEESE